MNGKAKTLFSIQGHLSEFFREVTYSVALVMAFLAAENGNRQLKDLPQAVFGRVTERFLLSVRQIL